MTIEWLHYMNEATGTPVIMICGDDTPEDNERCAADGVVAVFQKPVNNDELVATVGNVLNTAS